MLESEHNATQRGAAEKAGYFIVSMRWLFLSVGFFAVAGCAARAAPPPSTPRDPAELPQTEVAPREREPAPKLLAPPPAYGNKIVMARARTPANRF